jgi:hypothetical protein
MWSKASIATKAIGKADTTSQAGHARANVCPGVNKKCVSEYPIASTQNMAAILEGPGTQWVEYVYLPAADLPVLQYKVHVSKSGCHRISRARHTSSQSVVKVPSDPRTRERASSYEISCNRDKDSTKITYP